MKKLLFILMFCLLFQPMADARDYVKLHMKEMKHAQKYGATDQFFADYSDEIKAKKEKKDNIILKDPKLITLGGYDEKILQGYDKKLKADEIEYAKIKKFLQERKVDNFNAQAYSDDFYKVYRVAEKIIRANKLDYINWRIVIDTNRTFNASQSDLNCLTFNTGLIDTFKDNDDALAFIIGHEIAHAMLGHYERLNEIYDKMMRAKEEKVASVYAFYNRKFVINSKNAEFAADVEGAKLALKAMYSLDKAKEALGVLNTLDTSSELYSTHPNGKHRLKNFQENRMYFFEDEWAKQGKNNYIKTNVLACEKSSDRKSIVILRGKLRDNEDYYRPESIQQLCKRVAYKAYLNKEFDKAEEYFEKLVKITPNDAVAYLYLSYIKEYEYKSSKKDKHLAKAIEYITIAYDLDSQNKHIIEQKENLEK